MNRLKRKPFVIGITAAALVLALAAWQFAGTTVAESARLDRFLPADTIGFVQVNNLRAQARNVIESEAWRAFTKENQTASSLFMIGANHAGVLDASYAVALLDAGTDEAGKPRPQFVMVAEFPSSTERREFEHRALGLLQRGNEKGVTTRNEKFGDASIRIISKDERESLAYAQVRNLLVLSNAVDGIKKVLDVRAGKAKSLDSNEMFNGVRTRTPYTDGMFGFVDGKALARMIDAAPAESNEKLSAFRQFFHGTGAASMQSASFTSSFDGGRVVERFQVIAQKSDGGLLNAIAGNPPTRQSLLALVPEDAQQVFNASIANVPQAFDEVEALLNQVGGQTGKRTLGDVLREVSEKTGIDFRADILSALGSEICIAQLQLGEDRTGALLLNLKDEQQFAQTIEKLAQHKKQSLTTREYKGVAVRQLADESGDGLSYAFLNGNFVASGNARALERIIDTAQGGRSLSTGANYRTASAKLSGEPQFVYYNTNADYLNRLGRSLKSGETEFKTSGQAANLTPSFAFGMTRPDGFYVESHTPLGTFPRMLTMVTSKLGNEENESKGNKASE